LMASHVADPCRAHHTPCQPRLRARVKSHGYEVGLLVSHSNAAVLSSCVVQDAHHSRLVLDES